MSSNVSQHILLSAGMYFVAATDYYSPTPVLDLEGAVRLVDGVAGPSEGRVEVFHNCQWGTVCDDGWDVVDAGIVCRQLGYAGATSARDSAYFGLGVGPIWYDELACIGNETNLTECPSSPLGLHNCHHIEDAGAVCFRESLSRPYM